MGWIRISGTTLVNSDKISVIEVKKIKEKENLVLTVEGKTYICKKDILGDLIKSGIDMSKQFFAG